MSLSALPEVPALCAPLLGKWSVFSGAAIAVILTVESPAQASPPINPEIEASRASLSPRVERDNASGDGVYGRFKGDFDLSLRLGAEYENDLSPAVGASLFYFWTLGVAVDQVLDLADSPSATQRTSAGVLLRPLFLLRWDAGLEQGPAFLDLTLDSLTLGIAVHLPNEAGATAGPEVSLGAGLPLFANASGPWLEVKGLYRLPHSVENGPALLVYLAWHALFDSGLHKDP